VPTGPHRELTAVLLRLVDDPGHLVVAVIEDVVEEEDGPLHRREPLEHEQERHRERVGFLGVPGNVLERAVGHERLRQPLAHVLLAPGPRRPQLIDREPRRHGRQVGLGRLDLGVSVAHGPVVAQEGLLHDVLGLADAAEHAIRDREEQRTQVLIHVRQVRLPAGHGPVHHSPR